MRRATHHSLRWSAATAVATTVLLAGSSTALAGTPSSPGSSHRGESNYQGGQGFNLCLVARCATGSGAGTGTGGISQVQGVNFCFLAACSVRS